MQIVTIATKGQDDVPPGYIRIMPAMKKAVPEYRNGFAYSLSAGDQSFLKMPLTSSTTLSTVFETLSSAPSMLSPTRLPISSTLAFREG